MIFKFIKVWLNLNVLLALTFFMEFKNYPELIKFILLQTL